MTLCISMAVLFVLNPSRNRRRLESVFFRGTLTVFPIHKLEDTDFFNYICKYDIIFLYESWTHKKSDIDINGYKCFNFTGNFKIDEQIGAVAVSCYTLKTISDGVKILRNHHDSVIWLKLDRNVFNIESDIYIADVYIGVKIRLHIISLM